MSSDAHALRAGAAAGAKPAERDRSLPRKEAFLISDFQKSGWAAAGRHPPARGRDDSRRFRWRDLETANVAVTSVAFQRASFSGRRARDGHGRRHQPQRERRSRSAGQARDRRPARRTRAASARAECVRRPSRSTPITVAGRPCAAPSAPGTDALPADNEFNFVLSPSRPVSVLHHPGRGRRADPALYLDHRARRRHVAAVQDRGRAGFARRRRPASSSAPS